LFLWGVAVVEQHFNWDRLIACVAALTAVGAVWRARRESRSHALSEVLDPMIRAVQTLNEAIGCRRTCDQLKMSYPDHNEAPEAAVNLKRKVGDYGELIQAASAACKETEAAAAARSFRFPPRTVRLLSSATEDLFEAGRQLNDGKLDQAELFLAKIGDHYREITRYARGWRLAASLKALCAKVWSRRDDEEEPMPFDITPDRIRRILDLVYKRGTSQAHNPFAVHPPRALVEHPEIATSDKVIERLADSVFVVAFQDGTDEMLTLPEVMVFTYQLIMLSQAHADVAQMFASPLKHQVKVRVSQTFDVNEIMRPGMVKLLLSKITFSESPSDDDLGMAEKRVMSRNGAT
jgi:hypothetical protein